jgi:hypothetical protein
MAAPGLYERREKMWSAERLPSVPRPCNYTSRLGKEESN